GLMQAKKSRFAAAELPPTSRSAMELTVGSDSTQQRRQFRAAPNRAFRSLSQEKAAWFAGGFSNSAELLCRASRWFRHAEGFVEAASVNGRHLRSHGSKVSRQLTAMVDGMIVHKAQIEDRRKIEHSHEVDWS